jgi:transketolase
MSEATGNPEGSQGNVGQDAQSTQADSNVDYKALYHEEVENAKKQRHAKQDLSDQLSKFQKDQETAKVRGLKEQEKYKELAEELQKKVDTLSPFQEKYEAIETQTRNELIEQLPEEDREELASKDISTIRLFVNKFNNQKPSNVEHVPGKPRGVVQDKPWAQMTEDERRAHFESQVPGR